MVPVVWAVGALSSFPVSWILTVLCRKFEGLIHTLHDELPEMGWAQSLSHSTAWSRAGLNRGPYGY